MLNTSVYIILFMKNYYIKIKLIIKVKFNVNPKFSKEKKK